VKTGLYSAAHGTPEELLGLTGSAMLWNAEFIARLQILAGVIVKNTGFMDVAPISLVDRYRRLGGTRCLYPLYRR
jgi:hypothetical protein